MQRAPDLIGRFHLLATAEGGRRTPARSGYRPQHAIHENYQTSGEHLYPELEWLAPGEITVAHVSLVTPEAYPNCLWVGRVLQVSEGQHIVGNLLVTEVLNESLVCNPENYRPHWVEPASTKS